MTLDQLCALIQGAPMFRPPTVLVIKLRSDTDVDELHWLGGQLRSLHERTGLELIVLGGDGDVVAVEAAAASEHDVVTALFDVRRKQSVQEQAAALREQFIIVPRERPAGASSTKLGARP